MSIFSSKYRGAALATIRFFIEMEEKERLNTVRKGVYKLLASNYGNMALLYPAKVAKALSLPSHPVLLSLIAHYLRSIKRVTVTRLNGDGLEEVVWVRREREIRGGRHCFIFVVESRRKGDGG